MYARIHIYMYSHPVIQLHANIPFHFLKCCESNAFVLTMMMSLRPQINQVANYFSARQYPKHIIESANENVHSIHREDILRPSSKKVSPHRIPLILPFHPSIYPLRHIIMKHYKTLMTDQGTKDIFKLLRITSYRREHKLCRHLVRASETQLLMLSDSGTFTCKRRRRNTCKFVANCSAIHIEGPKGSFNVTETHTCISKNIVYCIICKRCNIIYYYIILLYYIIILADRITEHIRSIRNNFFWLPSSKTL